MKIKHPKEHDLIVQWILNNPETFLKNIGYKEPFTDLKKKIQISVKSNKTVVGIFDVQLNFQCSDDYVDPYDKVSIKKDDSESKHMKRFVDINIIVNVKMESATEQLRELKKIYFQHRENMKSYNFYRQRYVIVSTNDNFKSFFMDNDFIFYKF